MIAVGGVHQGFTLRILIVEGIQDLRRLGESLSALGVELEVHAPLSGRLTSGVRDLPCRGGVEIRTCDRHRAKNVLD